MKRDIWINDTTLRDGEQAPGVVFSLEEKIGILTELVRAGVPEVEVGFPRMTPEDERDIGELLRLGFPCRLTCWCRGKAEDLTVAQRCGAENVHVSFPLSDVLQQASGISLHQVMDRLKVCVRMAVNMFDYVSVGAQDVGRASLIGLHDFVATAFQAGAHRVRLADTVGIMTPFSVEVMMKSLFEICGQGYYEFHAHNDLGLATANSLAAVKSGCQSLSVTVNGLGERAGNAALEQVVMAAEIGMHLKTGIVKEHLMAVSAYVARASGMSIPFFSPVVGKNVFTHESGIHTCGQIVNKTSFQPFEASLVGREEPPFVIGRHSGLAGLKHVMKDFGIKDMDLVDHFFMRTVKRLSYRLKRNITKGELIRLFDERQKQDIRI